MDKFSALVSEAQNAVAILLNPTTGDFVLLDPEPVPAELHALYTLRGLEFAGVMGTVNGQARVALEVPIEDQMQHKLVGAFVERVQASFNARVPESESTDWLKRLHSLPDPRVN